MADQEDVGRDVAGVGVEVGDGRLVGQRADAEEDAVEGQRPEADPGGLSAGLTVLRRAVEYLS
jgi:hypothetical protein